MKKILKFIAWLIAILVVLLVVLYLTAGIWLRSLVSTMLPQMTKTPASVENVDVSLLSGKISLKGFKIGNPAGFTDPNAFELGEVSVKFEPTSLLTSKVIINEIKINGTKVDAEIAKFGKMNLMVINDNVQDYLGNPVPTTSMQNQQVIEQEKSKETPSKAVVVKDLKITNTVLNFVPWLQQRRRQQS